MNTEDLIRSHADLIATRLQQTTQSAQSEEDVRHEANSLLDRFISAAGLEMRGRHEYGLAGGRVDSKYGGVIIEYKDPRGTGRIGESPDAPGTKAVVEQIKRRFRDLHREEHVEPNRIFGVGSDGNRLVFVRKRGATFDVDAPQPVTPHSIERLLRALLSVGAQGASFTPDALASAFGAESALARTGIHDLYLTITATENPKALTFFNQWKILFGEVCGYDVEGRNAKVQKLAEHYGIADAQPAALLFSVHSYYAIFMKFLAAEIVGSLKPLGLSELKRAVATATSHALRDQMDGMERGGIWTQLGITNFLEGDLFAWYLSAWDDRVDGVVRGIARKLDDFDPDTLSVEPAESRDLLKKLYQNLFPKSVRHDLGEYYTPDWLAELTLNELGYDGDPDKRLLDPACGSGTFLVMALNRVRAWFEEHRLECGFREGELVAKILSNIIGFDLNPLAVMAARTNYLMAIRDLLPHARGGVELPVYMCDSIMTPAEYGGMFAGEAQPYRHLLTAAGDFYIPTDVARSREDMGKYAEALEFCVGRGFDADAFVAHCRAHGLALRTDELHRDLFATLAKLQKDNQNGIWARIIKNAFAPLFVEKVDYVVGNPPWVTFENLPETYRRDLIGLFDGHYRLFRARGLAARHGASAIDLSALFPYVAGEHYLSVRGRIAFVMTQTLLQSVAAAGFRNLRLPDGCPLCVEMVLDLVRLKPFGDATNRTAVLVIQRGVETSYPVPYVVWTWPSRRPSNAEDMNLQQVVHATKRLACDATPVEAQDALSPWLVSPCGLVGPVRKVQGASSLRPHKGCDTSGANGIFWVELVELGALAPPEGRVLVRNLGGVGRRHRFASIEVAVEEEFVYRLVRGRDVRPWSARPSCHILCAQHPTDFGHAVPESELRIRAPLLCAYYSREQFRTRLSTRAGYLKYLAPQGEPFYALYDIKNYTASAWKVLVREQAAGLMAAVVGPAQGRPVIPDHKLSLVASEGPADAHWACACLNSAPARLLVRSFGLLTQISVHTLQQVAIPKFDPKNPLHVSLSDLSVQAHEAAARDDYAAVAEIEREVDRLAAQLWGITDDELAAIHEALADQTPEDEAEPEDEDE